MRYNRNLITCKLSKHNNQDLNHNFKANSSMCSILEGDLSLKTKKEKRGYSTSAHLEQGRTRQGRGGMLQSYADNNQQQPRVAQNSNNNREERDGVGLRRSNRTTTPTAAAKQQPQHHHDKIGASRGRKKAPRALATSVRRRG